MINLRRLHQIYGISVWDTCALNGFLPPNRETSIGDSYKFSRFFREKVASYLCFIPETVMNEYNCGVEECDPRLLLINEFKRNGRVLCPDKMSIGYKIREVDDCKEKYEKICNIHGTDLRLFAWAYELGNVHGSAAIISNDWPLLNLWRELRRKEKINPKKLGFFPRRGLDEYGVD